VTGLDAILDGLEAELALERELGVRLVECDRSLLAAAHAGPVLAERSSVLAEHSSAINAVSGRVCPAPLDFAFLHDRPLSAAGEEMMAKIVAALGKSRETAPVVFDGPMPRAKALVVLGGNALKKWFPGASAAPGQWISPPGAPAVLVTYSPAYVLRFQQGSPAQAEVKKAMWKAIKSVPGRLPA